MKKIYKIAVAVVASLFFFSCHSDDEMLAPKITLDTTFLEATNQHTLSNIQVGDTLTYKFDISGNTDSDSFAIVPGETNNSIKHQFMDVDYELLYNGSKTDTIKTSQNTGTFKIVAKKTGNFQHTYKAIAYKGNDTLESEKTDLIFNAVRIIAYSYTWKYKSGGIFSHSKWKCFHKLYIDTGEQQYDHYLDGLTYDVKYASYNKPIYNFERSTNRDFHGMQEYEGGSDPTIYSTIDKIIFKKEFNGISSLIEYHNIPVHYMGRHDDWGYGGNNNW
ncbi:MAG: hypothetical protein ACK5MD_08715 [Flavobacteriales bacterium]